MASFITDSDSEIKQSLLICKLCQSLIKDPKSLPCLHAYCTTCLQTLTQGKKTFNCPQCGDNTKVPPGGVTAFPVASHLIALAEYVQLYMLNNPSIPCFNKENEDGHQDAAVKCMECDVYYCTTCDSAHRLTKVARHHTTIKLTDLKEEHFVKAAQRKVSSCEKHPNLPIEYFCLDQFCNIFICQRCMSGKHRKHDCFELEEKAQEYRTMNTKALKEEMACRLDRLKKLEDEIQDVILQNTRNHEKKVKEIKNKTKEIHKKADEQEKFLVDQEQKHIDDVSKYYTEVKEQVKDMSTSLKHAQALIQNMTSFSPHDELVKQHEEIQKKIDRALQESTSPELWIQSVSVISQGQPLAEIKQEVSKGKPVKCIDALDGCIHKLAVFEKMTVALHMQVGNKPTVVYVRGQNEAIAKTVKERIEKLSPYAMSVVPFDKDGQQNLVINSKRMFNRKLKILSLDCDDVKEVDIDENHASMAISVDDKNHIIYTDCAKPKAIRKIKGDQMETLFTNQDGNEVLDGPWYMTTNINGDVIVSDFKKRSLFIFNKNGTLTNTYKDFTPGDVPNPYGVCTCPDGWIYVSDIQGNCIHRLDKTGTLKDYIVTKEDGLRGPTALQWYKGMLVVGQWNGQIKYIKI